jgi:hypothetical protein
MEVPESLVRAMCAQLIAEADVWLAIISEREQRRKKKEGEDDSRNE